MHYTIFRLCFMSDVLMGLLCPEGIEMMERWMDFGRIERNLSEFREIWERFKKIEQIQNASWTTSKPLLAHLQFPHVSSRVGSIHLNSFHFKMLPEILLRYCYYYICIPSPYIHPHNINFINFHEENVKKIKREL